MNKIMTVLLAAAVCLQACKHKEEKAEEKKGFTLSDSMAHMITIDTVRDCHLADEITLSGEVSFNENKVVKIFPRSSGVVLEARVSLGDRVRRGQVLATIKSADVAASYSDLSSAGNDLAIAKRQLDNAEALYKNGLSSEREVNEARETYQKASSARSKIQSTISINSGGTSNSSGQYAITSPIDGYIVEKKVSAGSFIRPDMGDNLFVISDLQDVWVNANVYAQDIPKIRQNLPAKVIALSYPDRVFYGKIDQVSEVLDPQSRALRARITLPNRDLLLKPDMYARIIVDDEQPETALCIPTAAVIPQDSKNYVVICNSRTDLRIAEINIIRTVGNKTFIASGLQKGQAVVSKYQNLLFAGLTAQ